jgi:tetratricopeptide (TPR) repeat protein
MDAAWKRASHADSSVSFALEIDNIRAALTWAFGPGGDRSIAVTLAVASAPIWFEMSLLTECHGWMSKALAMLDAADLGTRQEMVLQTAFGLSLMFTRGMSSQPRAALQRANELAENLQEHDWHMQAVVALAWFSFRIEDYRGGLGLARRAEMIAQVLETPVSLSTADWMLGVALFYLGSYDEALLHARRAQRQTSLVERKAYIARWEMEDFASARCTVANALWAKGLFDQSAQAARQLLDVVQHGGHPISVCLALTWCGSLISLGLGDLETAERSVLRLKDHAEEHGLRIYCASALGFEGLLSARRGDLSAGERLLRAGIDGLHELGSETFNAPFRTGLAEILSRAGRMDDGLAVAEEALQRAVRSDGLWWMAEALRTKGEVLRHCEGVNQTATEVLFRQSLDVARRQGALAWELRAAVSLAEVYCLQGRVCDALELVKPIYASFTEGFETPDLRRAKSLLEQWHG